MRTINQFDEEDLKQLHFVPLLRLDEEFLSFSPSRLSKSVYERVKVIVYIGTDKYLLSNYGYAEEPKRVFSTDELLEKLNNCRSWYRVATTEEISYIFKKLFADNDYILEYKKMK